MTDKSAREILARQHCTSICVETCVVCRADADADIAALKAGGFETRKRPMTLRDWLAIRDEATAHVTRLALGDQTECVSVA